LSNFEFCFQDRGRPKHVYLMDMSELYLVAVRLHGWEFMAQASHINAKKAVRGLAADLHDFHEQGQRSSAAHLMQHGASAVGVAAIEDAQQVQTHEFIELEVQERRFELKRKAGDYELELAERQLQVKRNSDLHELEVEERRLKLPLTIHKQNLEHVDHFIQTMTSLDPDWRADRRLAAQAQDLLCAAFVTEPRLVTAQGSVAPESVVAPERPAAPERPVAPESAMAPESAAAARLESVSLAVREMTDTVKLRLEMLSPDAVAKVSAGDSIAGPRQIWRGRHCVHSRRLYRCRECKGL
jgi:hypothetical protein